MSENRKIASNSFIMYIRLIITSVIGLYSVRLLLKELGTDDYGLYAIIGGIVALFNVLSTTLISTSNRFLAVEIGKSFNSNINKIFNSLLLLHLIFSVFFITVLEIVGVWYVQNKLNVDISKIDEAVFVLHCSAFAVFFSTIIMPYEALVTVKEKFNVRAILEILNSCLNLIGILLLVYFAFNKLEIYAISVLVVRIIISLCYFIYCRINYTNIVGFKINYNYNDYKIIYGFFCWQLVSVLGNVISKQGSSIILNSFFGTTMNAAFGIADRIHQFVFSFVKNLNQVSVPQIMKNHSSGNSERSLTLVYKLSKYTYFIILVISFPILLSIDYILEIWLGKFPDYTIWFVILLIVAGLISSLESGFDAFIDATGQIRKTKVYYSLIFMSVLPIIYFLFQMGFKAYWVTIIFIFGEIVFMLIQISILTKLSGFDPKIYFTETIKPAFTVTLAILPQLFLRSILYNSFVAFLFLSLFSFLITVYIIFIFGLNKTEKNVVVDKLVLPIINKFKKH